MSPSSSTRWTCWKGWLPRCRRTETTRRAAPRNVSCDDWRARARGRARVTTTEDETPRKNTNRRGDSDLEEDDALGALDDLARENAGQSRRAEYANDPTSAAVERVGRAAAFAEKERVAEDRDAAPHAGRWTPALDARRWTPFDATCACLHSAWRLARFRCLSPPPRGSDPRKTRTPRDVRAAGSRHPTSRHPIGIARARASRAVRHRPGRGDGRRRVSGGARGVVGGGGRQHVAAWTLLSRRRGGGGAERGAEGAAGDWAPRSAPSSPAVPSSPARTTRRGWRLAARLLARGVRGGGRRGLPRRRSRLRRARRRVSPRRASRRFARRRGHRFETQRTRE